MTKQERIERSETLYEIATAMGKRAVINENGHGCFLSEDSTKYDPEENEQQMEELIKWIDEKDPSLGAHKDYAIIMATDIIALKTISELASESVDNVSAPSTHQDAGTTKSNKVAESEKLCDIATALGKRAVVNENGHGCFLSEDSTKYDPEENDQQMEELIKWIGAKYPEVRANESNAIKLALEAIS